MIYKNEIDIWLKFLNKFLSTMICLNKREQIYTNGIDLLKSFYDSIITSWKVWINNFEHWNSYFTTKMKIN